MTHRELVLKHLELAYSLCQDYGDFDIIIDGWTDDVIQGHDEDGCEYEVPFEDINFETDRFYELVPLEISIKG